MYVCKIHIYIAMWTGIIQITAELVVSMRCLMNQQGFTLKVFSTCKNILAKYITRSFSQTFRLLQKYSTYSVAYKA